MKTRGMMVSVMTAGLVQPPLARAPAGKRIAAAFVALVGFACTEDPAEQLVDAGVELADVGIDAGSTIAADSGIVEENDAGIEADAGDLTPDAQALRSFVERKMFGDGPVDNLVFDPEFTLGAWSWYALTANFNALVPLERHLRATTPTKQPAVRTAKDESTRGAWIFGNAGSVSSMMTASVWVGREEGIFGENELPVAAIVTVGLLGEEVAFDLTPDPSTQMTRDGITWIKLQGMVTDALGTLTFMIGDGERAPYWATAPAVVAPGHHSAIHLPGRPVSEDERKMLRAFAEQKRRRDDPRERRLPAHRLLLAH